jgi:hypothetical protein
VFHFSSFKHDYEDFMFKKLIPAIMLVLLAACANLQGSASCKCCEHCECCQDSQCSGCKDGDCACCEDGMCDMHHDGASSMKDGEHCPLGAKANKVKAGDVK